MAITAAGGKVRVELSVSFTHTVTGDYSAKQSEEGTVSEQLKLLNDRINLDTEGKKGTHWWNTTRSIEDALRSFDYHQDKANLFLQPKMFDDDGVTLNDLAAMIGGQAPQVLLALVSTGASTWVQEFGESYHANLVAMAKKNGHANPSMDDLVEVVDKGQDGKAIAATTSAFSAALELIGAKELMLATLVIVGSDDCDDNLPLGRLLRKKDAFFFLSSSSSFCRFRRRCSMTMRGVGIIGEH